MTASAALAVSVKKEARALWPAWAACVAALSAFALPGHGNFIELGLVAYCIGSVAIAALSIGHEYTHGTLPLLLSLPSDRRRLLLAKLVVVIPMLIALAALAAAVSGRFSFDDEDSLTTTTSVICALIMAPWLTMLCRSPLAGTVFALGLLAQIHLLVNIVGAVAYGLGEGAPGKAAFTSEVRLWSVLAMTTFAAAQGWRMFMRLEAGTADYPTLALPRWARVAPGTADQAATRRQHPLWLIIKKELRLQQMSLAVAGLYAVLWLAFEVWEIEPRERDALATVAAIYAAMLALLIGSLASAEERQMGTLEWQSLLPIAAWKQWVVKAGVALTLAVLLTFGLPLLLTRDGLGMSPWFAGMVVFLTAGSLYVSSLSDSGAKAFVVSIPVMLVVTLLVFRLAFGVATPPFISQAWVMVMLTALALWYAFENHRSAGRDLKRVAWQVGVMAAVPLVAATNHWF